MPVRPNLQQREAVAVTPPPAEQPKRDAATSGRIFPSAKGIRDSFR